MEPKTLREWCMQVIVASFAPEEAADVEQGVLRYLDWLEGLTVAPGHLG